MKRCLSALLGVLVCATAQADIRVMALFNNQATVAIDGQTRTLRPGQRSPEGALLISANSSSAIIEYKGQRASYTVGATTRFSPGLGQAKGAVVSIWPSSGMYVSQGSINGQSTQFLVDTGASYVSLNGHDARRLGIDYRASGQKISVSTASKVEVGYVVRLGIVKLGSLQLRDVEAVVLDGAFPQMPLLGMSFLSRVNMEHSGQELKLRQRW